MIARTQKPPARATLHFQAWRMIQRLTPWLDRPESKRRDARERGFEAAGGLVEGALVLDVGHVEGFGALHGQNIPDIRQFLIAAPPELLDDDILRSGNPTLAVQNRYENLPPPPEFLQDEWIIEKLEEFDFHERRGDRLSDIAFPPCKRIEDGLLLESHNVIESLDDRIDPATGCDRNEKVDISR